jgi:hypothetical protein
LALDKNVFSATGWNTFYMSVRSTCFILLLKYTFSLLIFFLDDVSFIEHWVLKSPATGILVSISPLDLSVITLQYL